MNSVGFENIISMSSSGEDSSTQSESGLSVAAGSVPDGKGQHIDDYELNQLRDAVAKREEEKKLIEAGKKRLRKQLDKKYPGGGRAKVQETEERYKKGKINYKHFTK